MENYLSKVKIQGDLSNLIDYAKTFELLLV